MTAQTQHGDAVAVGGPGYEPPCTGVLCGTHGMHDFIWLGHCPQHGTGLHTGRHILPATRLFSALSTGPVSTAWNRAAHGQAYHASHTAVCGHASILCINSQVSHNSQEPGRGLCDPCLFPFCATSDGQPCTRSLVWSAFAKLMLIASACACAMQHVASVKHESGRHLHFQADGRTSDAVKASRRQPVVQCCPEMIQMHLLICQVDSSVS